MRYCPKCQTLEDAGESPACPACGTVLLATDVLPEEELDRPVVLKWCENIEEAEVLKTALSSLGIDCVVEDERLIAGWINMYDGRGGATDTRVLVRLRDAEAALELLRRKDAGELAITEDDVPAESEPPGPDTPNTPNENA